MKELCINQSIYTYFGMPQIINVVERHLCKSTKFILIRGNISKKCFPSKNSFSKTRKKCIEHDPV